MALEWSLPGPGRFVRGLAGELRDGRSAAVAVPASVVPPGLQEAVRGYYPDVATNRLNLGALLNGRRAVVDGLFELLSLPPRHEETYRLDVSDFATHPDLGRRLIWVDCRGASEAQATRWGVFLRQYAAAATDVDAHRRAVFVTLCEGAHGSLMPEPDRLLTKRWWWGVVRPLDTEVFVAELLGERERPPAFIETVTEVAGFDLRFARTLVAEWDGGLRNLGALFGDHKLAVGDGYAWSSDPSPRPQPPSDSVVAWSEGIINAWGDHDPHRHSYYLHATDPDSLGHLIWRGQVRGLMPRIEIERQALAKWVYQRRDWLTPSWAGREIKTLEVSELAPIFEIPEFRRERDKAAKARWLRWARNQIAHLKILDASELQHAWKMLQ